MSFAPLIWKGFSIADKDHQQLFIGQICDLLNFLNSANGLSVLLNGQQLLGADSLSLLTEDLGVITANQTVSCAQSAGINLKVGVTTVFSPTIALTNMIAGTSIMIRFYNSSASPVTLTITASDPEGNVYTVLAYSTVTTNMGTGLSVAAGKNAVFSGASITGEVNLVLNIA